MSILSKKILSMILSTALIICGSIIPVAASAEESGAVGNGNTEASYTDGTYRGTGVGMCGDIVLNVTVASGKISKIETVYQKESFWQRKNVEKIYDSIIKKNGTKNVDAISGATFSCNGVKNAVDNALKNAGGSISATAGALTEVLKDNVNTGDAATVVYGNHEWNVIGYNGEGVASSSGNMTLLLKGSLGLLRFHPEYDCNEYGSSSVKDALNALLNPEPYGIMKNVVLTDIEKEGIIKRNLNSGAYNADGSCDGVGGNAVENQVLWLLSTKEAGELNEVLRILNKDNTTDSVTTRWWLRSPGKSDYYAATVGSDGKVLIEGKPLANSQAVRPAFNLNTSAVTMVTAKDGAKTADVGSHLNEVTENTSGAWKLTMRDAAYGSFKLGDLLVEDDGVTLSYEGAKTGENEYLSAVIEKDGKIIRYGKLKALTDSENEAGTVKIDQIKEILKDGGKLYVFNEHCNGSDMSDYSSALYEVAVESDGRPVFTQQPENISIHEGELGTFSVMVSGAPNPELQWQVKHADGEWEELDDGHSYEWIISRAELSQNGDLYRCVASNSKGSVVSETVKLTVSPRPLEKYKISVEPNMKAWGKVSGGGDYDENTQVTVVAAANEGYSFVNWTEAGKVVSVDAEYKFNAEASRNLVAVFEDKNAAGTGDYPQLYEGGEKLADKANTKEAATVWYGGREWTVVGSKGKDALSSEGTTTLMASDYIKTSKFADPDSENYNNHYSTSVLRTVIDEFAGSISENEKAAIQKKTLKTGEITSVDYTDFVAGEQVNDALLWPFSSYEAQFINKDLRKTGSRWWLRSPSTSTGKSSVAYVDEGGTVLLGGAFGFKEYGVRPALSVINDRILFVADSRIGKYSKEVGENALSPVAGKATDNWKLTLKDAAYDGFKIGDSIKNDGALTVSYEGAVTGENKYISAVVKDNTGKIKYYGRLKKLEAGNEAGEFSVRTAGLNIANNDSLYIFNEEYNGSYKTDYAGKLLKLEIKETQPNNGSGGGSGSSGGGSGSGSGSSSSINDGSVPKGATPKENQTSNPATADNMSTKSEYSDVAAGVWYADAVKFVTEKGLMNGTGEKQFAPGETTTRGMIMTVLARYAGETTDGGSSWYEKGMIWSKNKGISDGTNPAAAITREQLVTMLFRYSGSPEAKGEIDTFKDASAVSGYAVASMKWAVDKGIIKGSNGSINPKASATRAEVATILMRFAEQA